MVEVFLTGVLQIRGRGVLKNVAVFNICTLLPDLAMLLACLSLSAMTLVTGLAA